MRVKAHLLAAGSAIPPALVFIYMKEPYVSRISFMGNTLLFIALIALLSLAFGSMFRRSWEAILASIISGIVFALIYPIFMIMPTLLGYGALISVSDAFFGFFKISMIYLIYVYLPISILFSIVGSTMGEGAYD